MAAIGVRTFGGASDGQRIEGATVSVLEHPEMMIVTGPDGSYAFDVEVGTDVTLVMDHEKFPLLGRDDFEAVHVFANRLGNAINGRQVGGSIRSGWSTDSDEDDFGALDRIGNVRGEDQPIIAEVSRDQGFEARFVNGNFTAQELGDFIYVPLRRAKHSQTRRHKPVRNALGTNTTSRHFTKE